MQRGGIWFAGDLPVGSAVEVAVAAESAGVDSVWAAEGYYARDALTTLTAVAAKTERVLLGTGVVPVFTRHPALLAMSFVTLDELSNGRVIAGIGSGERNQMADELGYDFARPLTAVREAIEIMQGLFRGELVKKEGRVFSADGIRLGIRPTREIPIYAAAVGPKMCQLVGELGAGVYYPQASPMFIKEAGKSVKIGTDRAGRTSDSIDYSAMIIASVHEDPRVARAVPKGLLATLLAVPEGEHILFHNGLDSNAAPLIRAALGSDGLKAAVRHVDEAMVERLTVSGTAAEVTTKVQNLIDAGLNHPVLSAIGPHAKNVIPVAAHFSSSIL